MNNIKALGETQTLRAGCSKAETPFPEAQDGQNLISWRWSLSSPTDIYLHLVKIDACNFELSW